MPKCMYTVISSVLYWMHPTGTRLVHGLVVSRLHSYITACCVGFHQSQTSEAQSACAGVVLMWGKCDQITSVAASVVGFFFHDCTLNRCVRCPSSNIASIPDPSIKVSQQKQLTLCTFRPLFSGEWLGLLERCMKSILDVPPSSPSM